MRPDRSRSAVLYDAQSGDWILCDRPTHVCATRDARGVVDVLRQVEAGVAEGMHAAGFLAYEAAPAFDSAFAVREPQGGLPLAWFGLYRDVERMAVVPQPMCEAYGLEWQPSVSEPEYGRAFQCIKNHIAAGDTYQVNYSFRLNAPFRGDAWDLFLRMVRGQGNGFSAFVGTDDWAVCSASPELFFTIENGVLVSRPMKGTAARGPTLESDAEQARWLRRSEKNRAENVMIVDMVRNDMGRIAETGTVETTRLFDIEKYPTLWQMTSTVRCRTAARLTDVFQALFPAASITGAPKVRTMLIVSELETTPRGVYTGAVGFVTPQGRAQFNVAIRTVAVDRAAQRAEYGVGGGIVWDSERGSEMEECRTKTRILFKSTARFSLLETILWTPPSGYALLDEHLGRLENSSAYFSRPIDIAVVRERLDALARRLEPREHRVRLLVSPEGRLDVEAHALTPLPNPYRVRLASHPIDASETFLYHKTTRRRVYDEAKRETPDCDDVLLWNEKGDVTESSIANVVVSLDGRLMTPPVASGLLAGTYRSRLIAEGRVVEERVAANDLARCSGVWLMNSVRGMWKVDLIL